ncbi:hypothetical protein MAM1_0076c04381 [Mucor ambiguus]|uniref:RNA polymerase II subunit A C-terminal domain phosphatase n=1 Tax=Mucor ambiguus TaxID=91626 RepID=A0A0C9MC54_9FUNG|nr:hypothetical protein MAM1_0076c04381 [Mucor ambiguus]
MSGCNHKYMEHGRCWVDGCSYCAHETKFNGVCVACSHVDEAEWQQAKQKEKDDLKKLRSDRKLSLIIDLDNTLMHATSVYDVAEWISKQKRSTVNKSRVQELFTTANANNYSFKLRPGLYSFLTHISTMYELHVYTMGNTAYARTFLDRIDPHRNLFKGKILTRDGNGCILKKKMSRLYPTNRTQVLILDDSANVWDDSPNLIQIKTYTYFRNVKELNALSCAAPIRNQYYSFVNSYTSSNQSTSFHHQEDGFDLDNGDADFVVPALPPPSPPVEDFSNQFSISSTYCTKQPDIFLDKNIADIIPEEKETDDALAHIGKVLKDIHSIYFSQLACNKEPDVVDILQSLCTEKRSATLRRKRSASSTEPDFIQSKKCSSICRSSSSTTLTIP